MLHEVTIQAPVPCVGEVPTPDEAHDQLEYVHLLKKQKFEAKVAIPVQEITDSEEENFKVCH